MGNAASLRPPPNRIYNLGEEEGVSLGQVPSVLDAAEQERDAYMHTQCKETHK